MPTLTISGEGLSALRIRLQLARDTLQQQVGVAVPNIAAHIAQNLRDAAPVGELQETESVPPGDEPGKLQESFRVRVASGTGLARATVYTVQPLKLWWVVHGTGIYGPVGQPITPQKARVLRWVSGGMVHFARSVRGMPPRPFVQPVLEEGRAYAEEQLREVVGEVLTVLHG